MRHRVLLRFYAVKLSQYNRKTSVFPVLLLINLAPYDERYYYR